MGPRIRGDERNSDCPVGLRPGRAPFDWAAAIGFGLGVLRLSPDAFWRMTPRELALAIEAVTGRPAAAIERSTLIALMRRYPDRAADGAAGGEHD